MSQSQRVLAQTVHAFYCMPIFRALLRIPYINDPISYVYAQDIYIYVIYLNIHTLHYLTYLTLHCITYMHVKYLYFLYMHACLHAYIHTYIHACMHTRIYMYIRYILMMCVHSPQYIKTHERPECSTHPPGTSPKAAR